MSACVCVRKDENHFETISHKGMYVRVWVFVVKKASALSKVPSSNSCKYFV